MSNVIFYYYFVSRDRMLPISAFKNPRPAKHVKSATARKSMRNPLALKVAKGALGWLEFIKWLFMNLHLLFIQFSLFDGNIAS